MSPTSLLVANRGEIAVRILRAAAELGLRTVAVHSEDDALSLHVPMADDVVALAGAGPRAYLDADALVEAARRTGCDTVHPGYGFLSENPAFARRCAGAGLTFVGPDAPVLELLGDKVRARALAQELGIPVLAGTSGPTTLEEARAFLDGHPGRAVMVKAVSGGGGRGMRAVARPADLDDAWARCASEAAAAFGSDALYVEELMVRARHVEVQIVGDGADVVHLGERECSIQRRHQKVVEMAPAPGLDDDLRGELAAAAVAMAAATGYRNLGTFEFLVDADDPSRWAFIEANPRLQVEHTVTEEVTGVDLVATQIRLAGGATLAEVGLAGEGDPARPARPARGTALQLRVNAETMTADGSVRPSSGTLSTFEVPTGPGVRVDTFGYAGYAPAPRFDSLLAKLVVHVGAGGLGAAVARAYRALCEFRVDGVATNIGFLQSLLRSEALAAGRLSTSFVDDHLAQLAGRAGETHPRHFFDSPGPSPARAAPSPAAPTAPTAPTAGLDEGAVDGGEAVRAPLQGTVVGVEVSPGQTVAADAPLVVLEAMKMEHVVGAPFAGVVRAVTAPAGGLVAEGAVLVVLDPAGAGHSGTAAAAEVDLDHVRPDLAEAIARHRVGLDEARPEAVARRHGRGRRTARENIADLCDDGTFVEYGPLVLAAQRRRRPLEELIEKTPADGMVTGLGQVNGQLFGPDASRCVVMSYDYTVLAGTQGLQNHRKKDRMFELAAERHLPVVIFTEGGGGRPGDTDGTGVSGLDCMAFALFGRLSGLVPLVGITSGYCFAGNAALLGCCDVVIATEGSNIGMGGPAMIEGGGLGVFPPEQVGPLAVQAANGVVDVAVADEEEAVAVARRYLSYFQGPVPDWECADQRLLRHVIPDNRLRVYDVRAVIDTLADAGSVLELRAGFGAGMVTALARVEGSPLGVIANNPVHLGGAIDAVGADKAARFMQLCDAFDIPILFLCDTPGFMVGPEAEKTALVRHVSRMFVTGGSLSVPFFTIVLRKGYGLGAQAMAGGSFKAPAFCVSWPTGEFGGMGLEGAVRLGYRNELAAIDDPEERRRTYDEMVARMYEIGKGINVASHFEIDDVIDPADSRRWIASALRGGPGRAQRAGKKRPCIDTW